MVTERYKRLFRCAAGIIVIAFIFSGFTYQDKDSEDKTLSELLLFRTRVMQRVMFSGEFDETGVFEKLSEAEREPLIREDCKALAEYADSDADKIINMKIEAIGHTYKKANIGLYDVTVVWYMAGSDGRYTSEIEYEVRTVTINGKMKLYGMAVISENR